MIFSSPRFDLTKISCVLLLLICFCAAAPAGSVHAGEKPQPVWTIDLKKYGVRGPKAGFLGSLNDPGSMVFLAFSTSTVAVVFDTPKPSRIEALFFDPRTGSTVGKQSWVGDLDWHTPIFATSKGNFVLLTGGQEDGPPPTLHLLSPTGQEQKRILLYQGAGRSGSWSGLSSPSGRSLLMIHFDNLLADWFQLLDPDTFASRSEWSRNTANPTRIFIDAISDDNVLFSTSEGTNLIGKFGGPWRSILLLSARARFLTQDSLLTSSADGSINVVSDTGEQLRGFRFGVDSPRAQSELGLPFVSADGQRFGAVVDERRTWPTPPTRTIDVWQKLGRELILAVPLNWSTGIAEAALAADGSLLVAVNTQKIYAYKLPTGSSPAPHSNQ